MMVSGNAIPLVIAVVQEYRPLRAGRGCCISVGAGAPAGPEILRSAQDATVVAIWRMRALDA
jgi:hypothetical protein